MGKGKGKEHFWISSPRNDDLLSLASSRKHLTDLLVVPFPLCFSVRSRNRTRPFEATRYPLPFSLSPNPILEKSRLSSETFHTRARHTAPNKPASVPSQHWWLGFPTPAVSNGIFFIFRTEIQKMAVFRSPQGKTVQLSSRLFAH